jgi:Holliday junction resolvase RusA-like endonuclease
MISFFVPGKPVAQSRPRFARRGPHVVAYDAAPSKDYKSWVKSCAFEAMQIAGRTIIGRDVPLTLDAVINLERPKSKAKRFTQPTSKPDCDNVLKGLQDAMESIVYEADQQIVQVSVIKRYSITPGVTITIEEFRE